MKQTALFLLVVVSASRAQETPTVRTVKVRKVDLLRTVRLPGNVLPWEAASLLPHVTGYVTRVGVREGASVERADLLAEIDVPLMAEDQARATEEVHAAEAAVAVESAHRSVAEAEVAVRRGMLRRTEAEVALRKLQLARVRALRGENAATREQEENAEGELAIAEAAAEVAEAAVASAEAAGQAAAAEAHRARARLGVVRADQRRVEGMAGLARITCPYERGLVVKRHVDTGALVKADTTPLFEVMDIERVRAAIELNERDAVHVRAGTPATVAPDALPDTVVRAEVARVARALDPKTRTMRIEIDLDNRDHKLLPGMFVHVEVEVFHKPEALTVPASCLVLVDGEAFLYVVDGDTVRRASVTTGIDDGIVVEIVEGVPAGSEVVVSGKDGLRDGMRVRTQPEPAR